MMNYKKYKLFWLIGVYLSCIGCFCQKSFAAVHCPNLSISKNWELQTNTINYQNQKWYIYKFWNDEPTRSGGELPVPTPLKDLITARSIELLEQLDQNTCRYEVTSRNNASSNLVIKHIGN